MQVQQPARSQHDNKIKNKKLKIVTPIFKMNNASITWNYSFRFLDLDLDYIELYRSYLNCGVESEVAARKGTETLLIITCWFESWHTD